MKNNSLKIMRLKIYLEKNDIILHLENIIESLKINNCTLESHLEKMEDLIEILELSNNNESLINNNTYKNILDVLSCLYGILSAISSDSTWNTIIKNEDNLKIINDYFHKIEIDHNEVN